MGIKSQFLTVALGASVCLGSALAVTPQSVEAADSRADIVTFMVDDFAVISGLPVTKRLSNINAIRTQGAQVVSFNTSPICGPDRSNRLTGMYPGRHGVIYNNRGGSLDWNKTYLAALKNVGYYNSVVGRPIMNNLNKSKLKKVAHSVNTFYDRGKSKELRTRSVNAVRNAPKDKPLNLIVDTYAPHPYTGRSPFPYVEQQYRWAKACQGIGKYKPPLYKPGYNPNYPFNMPSGLKNGWPLGDICKSMLPFDITIGKVLAEQKKRGRDVYVFFESDHGSSLGHRGFANKANPYATRAVLYVKGPGIKRGKTNGNLLISSIDIGPTKAAIGGAKMPWAQGKSFLPILKGQKSSHRKYTYGCFPHPDPKISYVDVRYNDGNGNQWREIVYGNGKTRLHKPSWQPFEVKNFVKARPKLVKTLRWKVKNWAKYNCKAAL